MPKKEKSFPKRNKKIFFLAGFPRAGNTLLTSILNQNPDIGCTPNSIILEIYHDVWNLKHTDIFKNYPDHESLHRVMEEIIPAYYQHWDFKYIIDRGPAGTEGNLYLLKKFLKQEIKIIFLVRPILEVLASWISFSEKEPTHFLNKVASSRLEKCHALMNNKGQITKELVCMHNLLKPENKHHVRFVDYREIVEKPEATLKGIYKFLGIPPFKHRFVDLDQIMINGLGYDDTIMGKGVHTIKTEKLIKTTTDVSILPKEIIKQYGKIKFV